VLGVDQTPAPGDSHGPKPHRRERLRFQLPSRRPPRHHLGVLKDLTGSYASGLFAFAAVCVWGMSLVVALSEGWRVRRLMRLPAERFPG